MIQALVQHKGNIQQALDILRTNHQEMYKNISKHVPNDKTWQCSKNVVRVFAPVHIFIVSIQKEFATLSDCMMLLEQLYLSLKEMKPNQLASLTIESFEHYFAGLMEPTLAYVIFCAFDLRLKDLGFLSESQRQAVWDYISKDIVNSLPEPTPFEEESDRFEAEIAQL